jgi:hypothetical protein
MKWALAKRKMIVKKYGTPSGSAHAHTALLSDIPTDDPDGTPTLKDYTYEYDDIEASIPFSTFAFSSSLARGLDLSQIRVVDSACSINLTAFRSDFVTFAPSSAPSRVGGVSFDVKGSGTVRISIQLASSQAIHRMIHALYTPDLQSRSGQHIGRLLSVSWMQSNIGCEFFFLGDSDTCLIMVPT